MKLPKPCLGCGTLTRNPSRCDTCYKQSRTHYTGTYTTQAKQVRQTAVACWICGEGARTNDPWTADHYYPGKAGPLLPAHKSCNSRRQDTPPHLT